MLLRFLAHILIVNLSFERSLLTNSQYANDWRRNFCCQKIVKVKLYGKYNSIKTIK
ncbi:MAG: hypothetical protein ACEY3D_02780 [Rickettsia sp.]|uniref:hypothetical protein n=1 Tax=Rickettsia sp. TaxID=789 RepID=UPI00397C72D2